MQQGVSSSLLAPAISYGVVGRRLSASHHGRPTEKCTPPSVKHVQRTFSSHWRSSPVPASLRDRQFGLDLPTAAAAGTLFVSQEPLHCRHPALSASGPRTPAGARTAAPPVRGQGQEKY